LNNLKQPALAAKAFGKVTANELVKNFNDKRFIGTHINEGIALFMTAESLQKSEPEAAAAHYLKAIETLDKVSPYLRFVTKDQYAHAVHNVEYYKALSQHRLWNQTKNQAYLTEAFKSWRSYIETNTSTAKNDEANADKAFLDNARIYMKQAESTLATLGAGANASAN
jgi:hypothetical protein